MKMSVFDPDLMQAHLNERFFNLYIDGVLRTYPFRIPLGEPYETILPFFLRLAFLMPKGALGDEDSQAVREISPAGLADRCIATAKLCAEMAYILDRTDPKVQAAMIAAQASARQLALLASTDRDKAGTAKGTDLAGYSIFALLSNSTYVTKYYNILNKPINREARSYAIPLAEEIMSTLMVQAGRGLGLPGTLNDLDEVIGEPLLVLCSKVSNPSESVDQGLVDDVWAALVGMSSILGIIHPSVAEANFGMDTALSGKEQARAMTNTLWRLAAFFMEVGLSPLTRRVVEAEFILRHSYDLLKQQIPEEDAEMRNIRLRIEGLAHLKTRFRLKFPVRFLEDAFAARLKMTGADVDLPESFLKAMLGTLDMDKVLGDAHATTSIKQLTDPKTLEYPSGTLELLGYAPQARRALLGWLANVSAAAETAGERINADLTQLEKLIRVPSAFSMPEFPELHQDFEFGVLRGPDLGKSSIFDLSIPLFQMQKEGSLIAPGYSLKEYSDKLAMVNNFGLQIDPPPAVQAEVNADLAASSNYRVNLPYPLIHRVLSQRSLVPVFMPAEYAVGMFPEVIAPDIKTILNLSGVAAIPGASIEKPLTALMSYIAAIASGVGTFAASDVSTDPRFAALRRLALGWAGQLLIQVHTTGILGTGVGGSWVTIPWSSPLLNSDGTASSAVDFTWGAPTGKFIKENEDYVYDNWLVIDEDRTKDSRYAIYDRTGRVRILLCTRFPVPGPSCPEHIALMDEGMSSTYVTAYSAGSNVKFFTSQGFSKVQGHLLPFYFNVVKRYEPTAADTTQVFVSASDIIIAPRVLVTPALPSMIEPGEIVEIPDNEKDLRPAKDSLEIGLAIGVDGAETPEEAMAELKMEGEQRVRAELERQKLAVIAPEAPVVGETTIHPIADLNAPATPAEARAEAAISNSDIVDAARRAEPSGSDD